MTIGVEELLTRETRITRDELDSWIARRWVRPAAEDGGHRFAEVDVARVRLICEMRHDLAVEEDSIPVLLSLLDQVYALRRRLRLLVEAVAAQPPETRARILDEIRRRDGDDAR